MIKLNMEGDTRKNIPVGSVAASQHLKQDILHTMICQPDLINTKNCLIGAEN